MSGHPCHLLPCFHIWSVDGLAMGPPMLFLLFDDCHWTSKFINFHNLCDFNGSLMYGFAHPYHWFSCFHLWSVDGLAMGPPVFFLLVDDCHWTSKFTNFHNLCDFNGSLMYGFANPCHWFSCFHIWSMDGLAMWPPLLFLTFSWLPLDIKVHKFPKFMWFQWGLDVWVC